MNATHNPHITSAEGEDKFLVLTEITPKFKTVKMEQSQYLM